MAQKRRSKRKDPEAGKERAGMVLQDLTDNQVAERADELAKNIIEKQTLEEKKSEYLGKVNPQIKELEDEIARLAKEVDTHQAYVDAQMQFGEK